MNLLDFLLVAGAFFAAGYGVKSFRDQSPAKQASELGSLLNLEQRLQTMLSDAFNQALARLEQVADAKASAADTGPQVDAEATAAVNGLADKLSAPPAEG